MTQQTSPKGVAFIESHEGVVLKAYLCPAGKWTIGTGLTAASGVVTPKAGMVISRAEASNLLQKALRRNYEPRVHAALGACKQHVFDGGVSFDFNTGAIHKASWVKSFKADNMTQVRANLGAWVKGGGKVLPGLVRRRAEEADVIILDKWPKLDVPAEKPLAASDGFAVFVVTVSPQELAEIREGFRAVGFEPGDRADKVLRGAVEAFQRTYDLTVDGKIGRATLSTLQRELDARAKSKTPALAAVGGGGAAAGGEVVDVPAEALPIDGNLATTAGLVVLALAALYGLWLAYRYRDIIAARLAHRLPRLATFLRSF